MSDRRHTTSLDEEESPHKVSQENTKQTEVLGEDDWAAPAPPVRSGQHHGAPPPPPGRQEIQNLVVLKEQGALTEAEFQESRAAILKEDNDKQKGGGEKRKRQKKEAAPGMPPMQGLSNQHLMISWVLYLGCMIASCVLLANAAPTGGDWKPLYIRRYSSTDDLNRTSSSSSSANMYPGDAVLGIRRLSGEMMYRRCPNAFVPFDCLTQEDCDAQEGEGADTPANVRRRRQTDLEAACDICGVRIYWDRCPEEDAAAMACPQLISELQALLRHAGGLSIGILASVLVFVALKVANHVTEGKLTDIPYHVTVPVLNVVWIIVATTFLIRDNTISNAKCTSGKTPEQDGWSEAPETVLDAVLGSAIAIIVISAVSLLGNLTYWVRRHLLLKNEEIQDQAQGNTVEMS